METISILIPAYNEEKNIDKLLQHILRQKTPKGYKLSNIIVITSGCTDQTEKIVKKFVRRYKKIKLISQKIRKGKADAINTGLKNIKSSIVIVESADTLPSKNAISVLLHPFKDKAVGMSCGRPVPINIVKDLTGYIVNLVWELHHLISLQRPKTGELIAFRNVVKSIPEDTAVDESSIEAFVKRKNFKIVYVPEAVVRMKGPETIPELVKQRKRIFIGHLHLKKRTGYKVSTMEISRIIKTFPAVLSHRSRNLFRIFLAFCLELYIRMTAMLEFYVLGKNPYKWEMIKTTKDVEHD
jgi:cellulose synthase/poly-beta-1,6-N-acetylglucosamine synthase-like glycosyltransferase